jgi:hypothetical protein
MSLMLREAPRMMPEQGDAGVNADMPAEAEIMPLAPNKRYAKCFLRL